MPEEYLKNKDVLGDEVDRKVGTLVDKSLQLFMYFLTVILSLLFLRFYQYGFSPTLVTRLIVVSFLVVFLFFRARFTYRTRIAVVVSLVSFAAFGAISYLGLVSPALVVMITLPIVSASLNGARTGFILAGVMLSIFTLCGFWFVSGTPSSVFDLNGYLRQPENWIFFEVIYACVVWWGITLTSKQREYWRETTQNLLIESDLRQQSDERSTQTELWWGSLGDGFPGVLFDIVKDETGNKRVTRISTGSEEMFGFTGQEIIDDITVLDACFTPETYAQVTAQVTVAAQTMSPWNLRIKSTHLNGDEKWLQTGGKPVALPDGNVLWHTLAMDVTAQVQAEKDAQKKQEVLAQYQRQESIGQLSGGVAHDFNNLLAVIMGNLEFIRDGANSKEMIGYVDQALEATAKGADLTRNMLAFAKKAILDPVPLNLNDIASEATGWISRTIPENIDIQTKLEPNLRIVQADEGSVVSAMLNLIVNARDAMHLGGHLLVETSNAYLTDKKARNIDANLEAGDYVVLSVTDTGSGIASVDHDRIFDPFVTTTGPTKGTGLGLAMVQGFMRQSRGAVEVKSGLGKGATFSLFFRAEPQNVVETPKRKTPVIDPNSLSSQTSARILVVEDEIDLLNYLQAVLTRFGYQVQTALTGDAAWNLYNQDAHFDLVLTDHIMPGSLQGADLARKIHAHDPDIPVIIISGYAGINQSDDPNQPAANIDLFKPFKQTDLIAAVENALAKQTP